MKCLDSGLTVALEAEEMNNVEEFGREEGDGQVEDAEAEAHGGHEALDGVHGDAGLSIRHGVAVVAAEKRKVLHNVLDSQQISTHKTMDISDIRLKTLLTHGRIIFPGRPGTASSQGGRASTTWENGATRG